MEKANKKSTARDVFFYLLMIVTLYIGVISFITVLFQLINILLPDPLEFYRSATDSLRGGISALIVVWPVYLLMSWLIEKDMKKDSQKRNMWVRRWLLYLTLFISAITIIIDLITLINGFLGGDLSTRFLLKTIVVLAVAGSVFGYYLWSLKQSDSSSKLPRQLAYITSAVGFIAIVGAMFAVGSPSAQRDLRFDNQRVFNLQEIQSQVTNHWQQKGELPSDISMIATGFGIYEAPKDPETNEPYEYSKKGDLSFELCATFTFASDESNEKVRVPFPVSEDQSWQHKAGRQCFERTIDPDFFKDRGGEIPKIPREVF